MREEWIENAVGQFLSDRLACDVEAKVDCALRETVFRPIGRGLGELRLSHDLAACCDEGDVIERLCRERVAALLRRGELVTFSPVATEILPQGC